MILTQCENITANGKLDINCQIEVFLNVVEIPSVFLKSLNATVIS